MKVFYANEKYAKYGYSGMGYFMALVMAAFYIMLTGFMILFIFMTAFPAFDRYGLDVSSKLPVIPSGIITLGLIFLLLRIKIKEDSLRDNSFTKEYVNKAMNYLIGYAFLTICVIGFLGMKFLRHHRGLM
jgi:hypothetical protein